MAGDIDVWYQNPDTGGEFGFSLPLPPAVIPQIANGTLVPAPSPDGHELPLSPSKEADLDGGGGTGDDDPVLYPCVDCGTVAVKGPDGEYTDHCAKHTPKPVPAGRGKGR